MIKALEPAIEFPSLLTWARGETLPGGGGDEWMGVGCTSVVEDRGVCLYPCAFLKAVRQVLDREEKVFLTLVRVCFSGREALANVSRCCGNESNGRK